MLPFVAVERVYENVLAALSVVLTPPRTEGSNSFAIVCAKKFEDLFSAYIDKGVVADGALCCVSRVIVL